MLERGHRMKIVRGQEGFTLIEMLVTMAIALIVFAATLNALDVFSSDSQAMTQRNAAQDQARLAIDRISRQLRNIASPVTSPKLLERAMPYDIVFQTIGTPSSGNPQGTERVRYCIPPDGTPGSPATEVMVAQIQTWNTATPPAVPWSASACPDPAYPSTILVNSVTNRYQGASRPAFTYNGGTAPSNLTTVDTVGLDLFVNPTPKLADAQTELRSAVFLRNQQQVPVANFTYTPLGGGAVLLNAGTSYSPSGDDLSYSWSCTPGACSSTGAIFDWQPGAGTYTVTLTVSDPTGLQTTTSQQVTVT
jgi:prepilin-type N-terminal cleavage/methylation domain-containing protein